MTGVIQYTEELFNTAVCKHEKLTEPKLVSPLPRLSPRATSGRRRMTGTPANLNASERPGSQWMRRRDSGLTNLRFLLQVRFFMKTTYNEPITM